MLSRITNSLSPLFEVCFVVLVLISGLLERRRPTNELQNGATGVMPQLEVVFGDRSDQRLVVLEGRYGIAAGIRVSAFTRHSQFQTHGIEDHAFVHFREDDERAIL